MKAVTITDIEKAELREYPMPTVGENDVLIQIKACALCTMEQRIYLGKKDVGGYPVIAGHEASGVVVAVGERVKHCKVGDHVLIAAHAITAAPAMPASAKRALRTPCTNAKTA